MRTLKLQMQLSLDGFCAGANGELDWMTWNWDEDLKNFVNHLHTPVDTILLGRKMTDGFVSHWQNVTKNPSDESYAFAKIMVDTPKVVFTKTLEKSVWPNTVLAKGPLSEEISRLKNQKGKDLIVYGGAGFVSALVSENLIDEYFLFVNPTAIGKGLSIFADRTRIELIRSKAFDCGVVLLNYKRAK